ncbi:hypothetical protein M3Y97_00310500 [Aphelenchoides bicaudatus]|nr:hypothetical protein M3Y97_00310500 [Aphelenchoides bicaudatus]
MNGGDSSRRLRPPRAIQRISNISQQNSILQTPNTPRFGILKKDTCSTPLASTPKFKTPLTKEKFVKSVKFDFDEAKEKPNTSRSSIMDVNLLNHVQRSAFIAQQRSANQSLKASRTIKEQDIPESSTPKRSKMSVVKEEFVSASKFDFDKTKEKPILARPSIMEVNLLDPVQRAAFIAQRREYDRQRRQVSSFKSDNEKENM